MPIQSVWLETLGKYKMSNNKGTRGREAFPTYLHVALGVHGSNPVWTEKYIFTLLFIRVNFINNYQNLVISKSGKSHYKIVKLENKNVGHLRYKVWSWKFWEFVFKYLS